MFARVEITLKPQYEDTQALRFFKSLENRSPELRRKVRWARMVDVLWINSALKREELITFLPEAFWDPITEWMMTGNLVPSAAGQTGGLHDLLETAPYRPGCFFGIEKRTRPGVLSPRAEHAVKALEILTNQTSSTLSGQLLLLEGAYLTEQDLNQIAKEYFAEESLETITFLTENDLTSNDRFHQDRLKDEMSRVAQLTGVRGAFSFQRKKQEVTWSSETISRQVANLNKDSRVISLPWDEEDDLIFTEIHTQDDWYTSAKAATQRALSKAAMTLLSEHPGARLVGLQVSAGVPLFEKRKILEWIEAQADGCCQLGIPLLGGVTDFEVQHGVSFWMAALAQKSSTLHPVLHPALQHRFGQKIILIGASHSGASGVTSGMEREDSQPQFASLMNDRLYGEWLAELKHLGCLIKASSAHAGVLPAVIKMIPEGAHLDLDPVFESSADISEYQFLMSLAPGRVVLTLEAEAIEKFQALAKRRGIPYTVLGEVREQGSIQVYRQGQLLYSHESSGQKKDQTQGDEAFREVFLPEMQSIRPKNLQPLGAFESRGAQTLFELLSYPNICSKESWIKKHDLDQQGFAVIRPLHFSQICGPNDGALLKLKFNSQTGLMVGVGSCSRFGELSHDQLLERAVDEALRNLYASGLGTGQQVYLQSSWSGVSLHDGDWIEGPFEALCESYGAVHLGSFQHHHSLAQQGTLVVRALAKTPSFALGMSADFKSVGDQIYLLGDVGATRDRWLGLKASTLSFVREIPSEAWNASSQDGSFQKIYSWMSGAIGSEQKSLHSVHDVSEGGLLVTVAESLLARGMGAQLQFPDWVLHQDLMKWNFAFGEGFHSFVVSVPHALAQSLENEWSTCEVPFYHLGRVTADPILEIQNQWAMDLKSIRLAWKREGMVL